MPEGSLDLVFGKPMTERIREFGIKVEQEGDSFILLPANQKEAE
jgi:hypothetical protein